MAAGNERRDGPRREDYRLARILAATVIVVTIPLLLILDAAAPDYELHPVVLVSLITTLFGLLGLFSRDMLRR